MADGGFSSIDHWQAPINQLTLFVQEHSQIAQKIYDTSPRIAVPIVHDDNEFFCLHFSDVFYNQNVKHELAVSYQKISIHCTCTFNKCHLSTSNNKSICDGCMLNGCLNQYVQDPTFLIKKIKENKISRCF